MSVKVVVEEPAPMAGRCRRLSRILLICVLIASLPLAGCSLIFVKPAKVNNESGNEPNPDCSTSRVAPVVDTILAISNFVSLIYYSTKKDLGNRDVLMSFSGLWAGVYTGSAYYGYSNTGECLENKSSGWNDFESADPDERRVRKKRPTRLVPEPGVMRSN